MNKLRLLLITFALAAAGAFFYSCQKENTPSPVKEQGPMTLKNDYAGCSSCINLNASPVNYFVKSDQKTIRWGGQAGDKFSKIIDIEYYNTESAFVLNVKSTNGWSDLVINGVSSWTGGPVAANAWGTYTTPLTPGWEACTDHNFTLQVTGNGPVAVFAVTYQLTGICTATTLEANVDSPVCLGTSVTLTAAVSSGGDFTGGTITMYEGETILATATVGPGVNSVSYSYSAGAGARTFHAGYDGTGTNGYNSSLSAPVTLEGHSCCPLDGNDFAGEVIDAIFLGDGTGQFTVQFSFTSEDGAEGIQILGSLNNGSGDPADGPVIISQLIGGTFEYSDPDHTAAIVSWEGNVAACGSHVINVTYIRPWNGYCDEITGVWEVRYAGGPSLPDENGNPITAGPLSTGCGQ